VSLSFVQKFLKQYRETGKIAPKVRSQQTPPKLNAEGLNVLLEIVQTNNDATLEEIRNLLASKTGVLMSISTLHRRLGHLKLTLKKNTTCNGKRNRESSTATVRFLGNCAGY
jgi:transposase